MSKANQIYKFLPEDGSSVSGGDIRAEFELSKVEWDEVKQELKNQNKVILGRGRGGTVKKNLDLDSHTKAPKKLSKAEIAEGARQAKQVKQADIRKREKIEALAKKEIEGMFEDAERVEIHIQNYDGKVLVFPFYDGKAYAHGPLWVEV